MSQRVQFWKVESIGNDFVLVEDGSVLALDLPELARRTSQRRFSVGSDGLLVVGRTANGVSLRMFNPDGTEDFCGNGLRCAAHFAARRGWIGERTTISHLGVDVAAAILPDGSVRTELPAASFDPAKVPHRFQTELLESLVDVTGEKVTLTALSTGSTHSVLFEDRIPDTERFVRVGEGLEHHELFPERTSAIWAVVEAPGRLRIRIWERGAGETLGCGTGSSAAAVAYARLNDYSGVVTVANPGGEVAVNISDWRSPTTVTGLASVLFEGELA